MSDPLVSIAIPTYNQGPYIRECLQSIKSQSYKNIEIIIQDSESKDETEAVCRSFCAEDPRFKYFREKDQGQSDAINRALNRSSGKYWTWICSDDFYYSSNAIQDLVLRLEEKKDENCIGAFGRAIYVSDDGDYLGDYYTFPAAVPRASFQKMWPFSQPASLLKTIAVKKAGGVVKELNLGMDLDLFIKMTADDRYFDFVPHYVAAVRIQANSKSIKYRCQTAQNALALIRSHYGGLGELTKSSYLREYADAKTEEHVIQLRGSLVGRFVRAVVLRAKGAREEKQSLSSQANIRKSVKGFLKDSIRWVTYAGFLLKARVGRI